MKKQSPSHPAIKKAHRALLDVETAALSLAEYIHGPDWGDGMYSLRGEHPPKEIDVAGLLRDWKEFLREDIPAAQNAMDELERHMLQVSTEVP